MPGVEADIALAVKRHPVNRDRSPCDTRMTDVRFDGLRPWLPWQCERRWRVDPVAEYAFVSSAKRPVAGPVLQAEAWAERRNEVAGMEMRKRDAVPVCGADNLHNLGSRGWNKWRAEDRPRNTLRGFLASEART